MISKKAQGWIIAVIITIVVIIAISIILIAINYKDIFSSSPKTPQTIHKVIVFPNNNTHYSIYFNNYKINEGNIDEITFTELNDIPIENITLFCEKQGYYNEKYDISFTQQEIEKNLSMIACKNNRKISSLNLSYLGDFNNLQNFITLNVYSPKYFQHLIICTSWSAGIISINLAQDNICDMQSCYFEKTYNYSSRSYYYLQKCSNDWVDWSFTNQTTTILLPKGTYSCGGYWFTNCESVKENTCKPLEEIPKLYDGKIDKCWDIGKDLSNSTLNIGFIVKTMEVKNHFDKITFFAIDKELIDNYGDFQLLTDFIEDLGAKNSNISIPYII